MEALLVAIVGGVAVVAIVGAARLLWNRIFAKDSADGDTRRDGGQPEEIFDKEDFRLSSTGFSRTDFRMEHERAGVEAQARPGAVVKGNSLAVCLQDTEFSDEGLGLWISVMNLEKVSRRWFGPEVTAYGGATHNVIRPALHEEGGHRIFDVYPGDQYTAYYFFPFPPHITGPKFAECKSHDIRLTFWWSRGA